MKIEPKWLEEKDLKPELIKPDLPPMYNVAIQFGYDIENPEVKKLFQQPSDPQWYDLLGWSDETQTKFWNMLLAKCWKKWNLASTQKKKYENHPSNDYILDGPTNSKEHWELSKQKVT